MYATSSTTTAPIVPGRVPVGGHPSIGAPGHDLDHGFCSVCGAVWPCGRARRDQRAAQPGGSAIG
jgi:hypothetical protein